MTRYINLHYIMLGNIRLGHAPSLLNIFQALILTPHSVRGQGTEKWVNVFGWQTGTEKQRHLQTM